MATLSLCYGAAREAALGRLLLLLGHRQPGVWCDSPGIRFGMQM